MQGQGTGADQRTIAAALARRRYRERERMLRGVLSFSGEFGYRQATVRKVLAHGGGNVNQFYRHFRNLEDCFSQAYEAEGERLVAAMLAAGAGASSWLGGVRAALTEVLHFATGCPAIAKALVWEVHVAGGAALEKHNDFLDRLARALDRPHPDTAPFLPSRSPLASAFVVGAGEGLLRAHFSTALAVPLPSALAELMYLVAGTFLGDEAAEEELAEGGTSFVTPNL